MRKKVKYGLTIEKVMAALIAWSTADENDKSTAWMLQYMQDTAGIDLDAVHYILRETPDGLTHEEACKYWANRFNQQNT